MSDCSACKRNQGYDNYITIYDAEWVDLNLNLNDQQYRCKVCGKRYEVKLTGCEDNIVIDIDTIEEVDLAKN